LSTTFADRTPNPRARKPLYPKKQGFAPESVFIFEFTRGRIVTLSNYLMMGG
jgi:hypothetical protein